ncbi:MAG: SWIM zinc finger family protein [archaeon]
MKIRKVGKEYEVESASRKGTAYTVDPTKRTCTCPAYTFKYSRMGLLCKHLEAVLDHIEEEEGENGDTLVDEVKSAGEMDSVEACERFGEDAVERALASGQLIEERGRLRSMK